MLNHKILLRGHTPALEIAAHILRKEGRSFLTEIPEEATHLLLPVPSLTPEGKIVGGDPLSQLLPQLKDSVTVIGGILKHPLLADYTRIDLLEDPIYLAENAYITAHCAVRLILEKLPVALRSCPVLVIGWGRIGKCLATMLKGLEANVTVAARKETDRAMLSALGYGAADSSRLNAAPYRVILNTVPVPIAARLPEEALCIDLASVKGLSGNQVIWARGLPGRDAPEASGELIAKTILRKLSEAYI